MRIAGFLFLVAALALLGYAFFFFDVSVGSYDGEGRTINIGLLDMRGLLAQLAMTLLVSAFLFIVGDEIRDAIRASAPQLPDDKFTITETTGQR